MDIINSQAKFNFHKVQEDAYAEVALFYEKMNFSFTKRQSLFWKFNTNPLGPGSLFVLREPKGGIIGTMGFVLSTVDRKRGRNIKIYELVDGILDPEYRGMGLFDEMQKQAWQIIKEPVLAFPNEYALNSCVRLGFRKAAAMDNWISPIRTYLILKNRYRVLSYLIDIILNPYVRLLFRGDKENIQMIPVKSFTSDYADTKKMLRKRISSSFLNWRFVEHPSKDYKCFEFFKDGQAVGYCVYKLDKHSVDIFDMVSSSYEKDCFRRLFIHCSEKGYSHITFPCVGRNLWKFGFFKRPGNRYVLTRNLTINFQDGYITLSDSDW
jgi:hypothetical protein